MPRRRPRWRLLRSLCAEVGPDDGIDPRERSGSGPRKTPTRKSRQLCGQVAETLQHVLAGESGDDLLRGLLVVKVAPGPDSTRLLVTVAPLADMTRPDPAEILERLARAAPRLRREVASAITRRRTPTLGFRLALPASPET